MPLDALLQGLWMLRARLAGAAALLLVLGASLVLLWPRQYVAEAVVTPAETTGLAASNLIQGNFLSPSGLLDTRPTGNFAVYLTALRSPEAAAMLARETPLLDDLALRKASGVTGVLRTVLGLAPAEADLDDVQRWLERNLATTQSLSSVAYALSLPHPDRARAIDLLARLHLFAEAQVRDGLLELTRRRIAALEARLATERDIYVRTPLFELLAQHQRAALVAGADEAVAARLVSAPSAGLAPELPNRPFLLALLLVAVPLAVLLAGACSLLVFGLPAPPPPRRPGARRPALVLARSKEE